MRAFYNQAGELTGYVESEQEDGFSIEGTTSAVIDNDQAKSIRDIMKDNKRTKNPKDIKPPQIIFKDLPTEPPLQPIVTPNPRV